MADLLTIGELARRTGLTVSAIRFYEERGLVAPIRTGGNQRRFLRSDIRRLSFALIAQRLGLTVGEIEAELATLPNGRAPNRDDWRTISAHLAPGRTQEHRWSALGDMDILGLTSRVPTRLVNRPERVGVDLLGRRSPHLPGPLGVPTIHWMPG